MQKDLSRSINQPIKRLGDAAHRLVYIGPLHTDVHIHARNYVVFSSPCDHPPSDQHLRFVDCRLSAHSLFLSIIPLVVINVHSINQSRFHRKIQRRVGVHRNDKWVISGENIYIGIVAEFQFPPHHLFIRSPACSSYSAFVTLTFANSPVFAKSAIPLQASNEGSVARTISKGISGGRMGRREACSLSTRPGNCEGPPVMKTF